ncbi:hypothetical protein BamMC406_6774 (plasmid) [Burkholderia ambifaria MC40-6]|uniref:DUF5625 domain-containing protein n=1 Tax=Burkholderia ambifaria (strain MC40-6) TaxID=398577 RepID=B1Z6U9_BURA4|nr:DUF5625 family protein [Burkholderia ambifaria]ACB69176.1 hypothetical protein BamMC406_6774 [Burkholderia ambifaria MC40-6]
MKRHYLPFRCAAIILVACLIYTIHSSGGQVVNARALFLPIDISKPGAHVRAQIEVKNYSLYVFYINAHYKNEDERKRVFELVGSGARLKNGGGYAEPGQTIPVHIKLRDARGVVLLDVVNQTKGSVGHGLGEKFSGEYIREIDEMKLNPGIYDFEVGIQRENAQFRGIECAITIGVRPQIN